MTKPSRFAGWLAIALAGIILTANVCQAQPGGAAKVWEFIAEKYDKNKDGKIGKEEYERGNDAFIMGHVHHPLHDVRHSRDFMILGDWIEDFTYGRLTGGRLSLETFRGSSKG